MRRTELRELGQRRLLEHVDDEVVQHLHRPLRRADVHEAAGRFGLLVPTGGEAPGALDEVERTFDGREDLAQVELACRSRQTVASVPSANRLKDAGSR